MDHTHWWLTALKISEIVFLIVYSFLVGAVWMAKRKDYLHAKGRK